MSRIALRWAAWRRTRRSVLFSLFGSALAAAAPQDPEFPNDHRPPKPDLDEDPRLPDGKSQKNAIAKEQHEQALRDANDLLGVAQQLRDELQKAGTFVVPMTSVRKTEEIEKLAKRIRGRLKY